MFYPAFRIRLHDFVPDSSRAKKIVQKKRDNKIAKKMKFNPLSLASYLSATKNRFHLLLLVVVLCLLLAASFSPIPQVAAISAYWSPIIPAFCSAHVSANVTQSLYDCDALMDQQLATIFDGCVRSVFRMKSSDSVQKPKLCYYARSGNQLDRCKMAKYRREGITLPDLVDREQEHTWCLMKIAQPLGWERLCSDKPADLAFSMSRQAAIQSCEVRFAAVTKPIRECFGEEVLHHRSSGVNRSKRRSSFGSTGVAVLRNADESTNFDHQNNNAGDHDRAQPKAVESKKEKISNKSKTSAKPGPERMRKQQQQQGSDSYHALKPAACLSFQYSRKIWKCLSRKESTLQPNLQRTANQYIACLRAIRQQPLSASLKPIKNQLIS